MTGNRKLAITFVLQDITKYKRLVNRTGLGIEQLDALIKIKDDLLKIEDNDNL